jgi:phytoene dehydrogenase-like protein
MHCLQERGSAIAYRATVDSIITEGQGDDTTAVGVRLKDGQEVRGKAVISNATRWDTFGRLLPFVPANEAKFRKRYVKSPSFITLHLGVKADVLPVRRARCDLQVECVSVACCLVRCMHVRASQVFGVGHAASST